MDAPLDTFRPSTFGWLKGTLAGWGTMLLFIAGIVLALLGTAGLGMYWLVLSLAALGLVVWRWLENLASKYQVTEERLIIRRGLIAKSVDEIELYRIKDVRINFSIINQLAGIGTISISSSDETTRDGDLDMVLHFRTQLSALSGTETEACVRGTFGPNDWLFQGCDVVTFVP